MKLKLTTIQVAQIKSGVGSESAFLKTENRFTHLVSELDLTPEVDLTPELDHTDQEEQDKPFCNNSITYRSSSSPYLVGGGDQEGEASSPPKKKRCRGKGRSSKLDRRRKSSRISTEKASEEKSGSEEIPGPSSKADERIAAWKSSPQGKASIAKSNKKYRMKEKSVKPQQEASERYEVTEKAKRTRHTYESEHGKEKRRIYESDHGKETRRVYESEHGRETRRVYESEHGRETRRRYESADGKKTREEYRLSEAGKEAVKRYKDSKKGREAQINSRLRYKLKEAAKNKRLAYKRSVKKAINHLAKRAAEVHTANSEAEHQFFDEQVHGEQSFEDSERRVEDEFTNKKAMTEIRSHLVSRIHNVPQSTII